MPTGWITPPSLDPGDRVAVIAPSSGGAGGARHVFALGVARLREVGVEPVVSPTARQGDDFLRANPRARAAAVHDAFRDPGQKAVIATIGGDDQLRVLRHLDPAVLRDNPTRFFGMSDNTCLAAALYDAGVVSYYGGQLMNQIATPGSLHAYTERYLRRALFEASPGEYEPADEWTDDVVSWSRPDYAGATPEYETAPGPAWAVPDDADPVEGRVWGGCLAVLRWLLAADRHVPDSLDGAVLAIETAEDRPGARRVRWTLQAMGERGLLGQVGAVLVGRPQTRNRFEDPGPEAREEYRREQRETIERLVRRYNPAAPIVFDLDFGHTNPTIPLPVGGQAVVDPAARSIRFPPG